MCTGLPLIASLAVAAGCASTNESVREEIARTEATVQQVQQSGMTRDAGGLELEQAKDKVAQARRALDDGKDERALRLAQQARLDADLAQAKARSHETQRSAEEVRTSIEQLRRESQRSPASDMESGTSTTVPTRTMPPSTTPGTSMTPTPGSTGAYSDPRP